MKDLLWALSPILFLVGAYVGGVYLLKYIVSRFFDLK